MGNQYDTTVHACGIKLIMHVAVQIKDRNMLVTEGVRRSEESLKNAIILYVCDERTKKL